MHPHVTTWLGAFVHRSVVDLVLELGSVVVHVNDIDVEVYGVLHLVPVHVHSMGSKLDIYAHKEGQWFALLKEHNRMNWKHCIFFFRGIVAQ